MKILMAVPSIPYPPTDGGKVRSYYFIREASKRHAISLFCIKNPGEAMEGLDGLKPLCRRIHWASPGINYSMVSKCRSLFDSLPFGLMAPDGEIERNLLGFCEEEDFDLLHIQGMEFISYVGRLGKGKRLLFDMVDCNSLNFLRRARWIRHPIRRLWYLLQYRKFRRAEMSLLTNPLTVLLTSRVDLDFLFKAPRHPDFRAHVLPDGVDLEPPFHRPETAEPWSLVFTGNMSYYPNEDAVRFFCQKILPLIQKRLPQVRFDVLGKDPSPDLVRFADGMRNVSVTGFIRDLKAEMTKRSVYVCPLRIGTGVKVKLLEAMSSGMPVIATPISAEGLEVEDGKHLLIASSPDEFAEKVLLALSSLELRGHLGIQAQMKIQERYTWDKIGQELESVYGKMVAR